MCRSLKCRGGEEILLDDVDYQIYSQYVWNYQHASKGKYYVSRTQYLGNYLNKKIYLHREIMRTPAGLVTDHIDGNTLNNQRANLRICTQKQNTWNVRSSGGGVHFHKLTGKYRVQLGRKSYGLYNSLEEAIKVRNEIVRLLRGEFANTLSAGGSYL